GASKGSGLGHDFLRHIQRAGVLIHLVEPVPDDGTDAMTNYRTIRQELVEFDKTLGERPEIVVITKADLPEAEAVQKEFSEALQKDVFLISAATGQGLRELSEAVYAAI
ncbi:MAG: GTPase ObgE, partial [Planctomycetaceae bacterium]|nr:GTPase ObgE [Planctomycetaceae bacterium]